MPTKPRITKSIARDTVAPIWGTGHPLKEGEAMEVKQKWMSYLGHMIKFFVIRTTFDKSHKRGHIIDKPYHVSIAKEITKSNESLDDS